MGRCPAQVRQAVEADAPALVELWSGLTRRTSNAADALIEARTSIARALDDDLERIVVAVHLGSVIGAAHLSIGSLTPISPERVLKVSHLTVDDDMRRRGVGRALMDAAVSYAEDRGISSVMAASPSNSRDANRFMARLGLAQIACVRVAPTAAMRAKLPVEMPAIFGATTNRQLGQVIAARRSQRRQQQSVS
jgi:N-acetylglutamate synthase-like GNAT family acetyltransferase